MRHGTIQKYALDRCRCTPCRDAQNAYLRGLRTEVKVRRQDPIHRTAMPTSSWQSRAACRDMDTELFFMSPPPVEVDEACAGCPVRAECLIHAEVQNERGVWGGTREGERRAVGGQG